MQPDMTSPASVDPKHTTTTIITSNFVFLFCAILALAYVYYMDEAILTKKFVSVYTDNDLTFSSGEIVGDFNGVRK